MAPLKTKTDGELHAYFYAAIVRSQQRAVVDSLDAVSNAARAHLAYYSNLLVSPVSSVDKTWETSFQALARACSSRANAEGLGLLAPPGVSDDDGEISALLPTAGSKRKADDASAGTELAVVPVVGVGVEQRKHIKTGVTGLELPGGVSTSAEWLHSINRDYAHRFPFGVLDATPSGLLRQSTTGKVRA